MEEITKFIHEMNTPTELIWALLGTAGGVARVFGTWLNQDPKPKTGAFLITIALNVFISGFTGYLGAVFGSMVTTDDHWHVIFAGVFGYMGVNGLEWLSSVVKEKFNPQIK